MRAINKVAIAIENTDPSKRHVIWDLGGSNVSKNGIALEGSMIDILVVDHPGEACHSIPDLEVGHGVPNCNNYTAAIAAENSRKCVDCKTIVLDFPVHWICCNCGQVSVQVSCYELWNECLSEEDKNLAGASF